MGLTTEHTLRAINQDRFLASSLLFSHRHPQDSPQFHVTIMDLWRSASPMVNIQAFREGGKTTLSEEFILLEALFHNFNYLLLFCETYTKACQRLESIKHELVTNQKIYSLFGKQKGNQGWSENRIILPNGVCLEAHGWEEEIRGYKNLAHRPDRALLDDIENMASVRDKNAVDKGWRKIHVELLPAMDKDKGKIWLIGTPLADDCLINRASLSPDWVSAKFPICNGEAEDEKTEALWPDRYPMEWIRTRRKYYENNGLLKEFNQEYMMIPSGIEGRPFQEEMLRFTDVAPRAYSPKVLIVDPARTADVKSSDQTGYVVVSRVGTKLYIHESGGKYWQPNEVVDGIFNMVSKYDCEVSIEKNSLDNWLLHPIRTQMLRLGVSLKLKTLNAPQDRNKLQFIMGLQSFFSSGDVVFVGNRSDHTQLVSQILNFPTGKKDILNALAYVNRVFTGESIYPDFSDENIFDGYNINRKSKLLLLCNSDTVSTTAILCVVDGEYVTVISDWVSPLIPSEVIPGILSSIRASYPRNNLAVWLPADVFDQVDRNPLIAALKSAKISPNRSEYAYVARGSLSNMIRMSVRGRRLLMIESGAKDVLHAMAMGYNFPIKNTGEVIREPERNASRTLIEALECATYALSIKNTQDDYVANAVNSTGTPYRSALNRG